MREHRSRCLFILDPCFQQLLFRDCTYHKCSELKKPSGGGEPERFHSGVRQRQQSYDGQILSRDSGSLGASGGLEMEPSAWTTAHTLSQREDTRARAPLPISPCLYLMLLPSGLINQEAKEERESELQRKGGSE